MDYRFLWVEFQLEAICAETSDYGIEKALESVPEDMDETYGRILEAVNKKPRAQRELVRKILIWTIYSRHPVPIDMLAYALSIERDTTSLDTLRSSVPTEKTILSACANLIFIDGNDTKGNIEDSDTNRNRRCVRFVHFSVKEFLTSSTSKVIENLRIRYETAHREIAQACMSFLSITHSQPLGVCNRTEGRFRKLYAELEWPRHLFDGDLSQLSPDDKMVTLTSSFFEQSPTIHASQFLHPVTTPLQPLISTSKSEHQSIMYGKLAIKTLYLKFSTSVLALIFNLPGAQICDRKSYGNFLKSDSVLFDKGYIILSDDCFSMHYAADVLDSVRVAQRLYNHGYPIDFPHCDSDGEFVMLPPRCQLPPLYSARSTQMARFLLDNGADVEPRLPNDIVADPLEYFAGNNKVKILELLLDRVIGQHGGKHRLGVALRTAVGCECLEAVRLLLDKGADINAQDGGGYLTTLQAATCSDRIEVIQQLLDKGADINAQGGEYGTALQTAAATCSFVGTAKLLLDKGADVNAKGGRFGTALIAAAACSLIGPQWPPSGAYEMESDATGATVGRYYSKIELIRLLLDRGADVHAMDEQYGTALQAVAAAAAGYDDMVEVIQLFLDKGADVNVRGGKYGTALQAAVGGDNHNLEVIKVLLDNGADANAQGGEYGTVLQATASQFNEHLRVEAIQLFLEKGVDVNARGGKYGTALQAAAYTNKVEVVRLLLDNGADINANSGEYGTALQAAAAAHDSNVEVIQLLLDKGADVNAQGGTFGTALQAAVAVYKSKFVIFESDNGVAAFKSRVVITGLLLDKGADVNAHGGQYGTALQAAAYRGKLELIHLLLDKGADANAQGGEYGTALQAAVASTGDTTVEVIELLLDKGADINAQGGYYGTAFHAAAYYNKVEVMHLLLDKGANVGARGGEYGTALQAALAPSSTWKETAEVLRAVEFLLDNGADITTNVPDSKYGNAVNAAKELWKVDKYNFHAFMERLESRGLKGLGGELGSIDKTRPAAALVHVWRLFGFAFIALLVYVFSVFWV